MSRPLLTVDEIERVNSAGRERGCHRCGTGEPGTASGNFVPEYHPPGAFGATSVVIPSCLSCSRIAGAHVTISVHRRFSCA